ncbi:MAG: glycosyltransferase, partial [Elusimicrobiota bacterium]
MEFRLLRIGLGGNIEAIKNKFGNLDIYKQDRFSENCELNIRFNPCGTKKQFLLIDKNFYIYEMEEKNKFLRQIKYFINLIRLCKKYKINILHVNTPYLYAVVPLCVSKLLRIPFCVSIHADYEQRETLQENIIPKIRGSRKVADFIEKFVYKSAERILPIRESMIPTLVRKGINSSKIRIFPHGIDLSGFEQEINNAGFRNKFNIPYDKKIISMVGRFEKENYIYDYIKIAESLLKQRNDWVMVLAGGGKERDHIKNEIKKRDLERYIILTGFISHRDVIKLRKLSYINLCLMAGFSLIEACAAGRPVIS